MSEEIEQSVIIRYANQSGALIEVRESHDPRFGDERTYHGARCTGCLDEQGPHWNALDSARSWAQSHSEFCRALPQPEPTDQ